MVFLMADLFFHKQSSKSYSFYLSIKFVALPISPKATLGGTEQTDESHKYQNDIGKKNVKI